MPGEWLERPARLARPLRMSGVLDRRSHQLAGTFDDVSLSNPYFVLARPSAADQSIFEPIEEALERAGPERSVKLGRLKIPLNGGAADLDKVRDWAERFASEFPEVDLRRTTVDRLTAMARNLFEDQHFSRYFGKTYDRMSAVEREKVLKAMRERQNGRDAMGPYAFLSSAFSDPHGQFSPADVTIGVLAQRALRNWSGDALGRLDGLLPVPVSSVNSPRTRRRRPRASRICGRRSSRRSQHGSVRPAAGSLCPRSMPGQTGSFRARADEPAWRRSRPPRRNW